MRGSSLNKYIICIGKRRDEREEEEEEEEEEERDLDVQEVHV